MHVVYDHRQLAHAPSNRLLGGTLQPYPESPARAVTLLNAARESGLTLQAARDFGWEPINKVHDADYLAFLQTAWERWAKEPGAGEEVIPHVHPGHYERTVPKGIFGIAGRYMNGPNCPLVEGSLEAIYASAQTGLTAADLIRCGTTSVYALCRPPGHHAHSDFAGGFCYLNNAAITAEALLPAFAPVAVIDIDVHHGNGTQEIFWERNDVFCGSLHAHPENFFPFYQGYADELGAGEGTGWNLNFPMPRGAGNSEVLAATRTLCNRAEELGCRALVVALGFDTFAGDPLGAFKVTTDGFKAIASVLADMGVPTVLVQEGGYDGPSLAANLQSFLIPFVSQSERVASV